MRAHRQRMFGSLRRGGGRRTRRVILRIVGGLFAQQVLAQYPAINEPLAWPDLAFVVRGETAYAFGGTDVEPYNMDAQTFIMPYWRCFSSTDLVHWQFESMLDPADTYMGASDKCFASHGVERDGKWFWYFSNFVTDTGVAVADSPKGPWKDALGTPLLPKELTPTKEYDKSVLVDDDGRAFIVFGAQTYYMAELNADMISLKTEPKPVVINGIPEGKAFRPHDAPFLHKANGLYYLSWRRPYAIAKKIEGPYEYAGMHNAPGHGGFFQFRNQWFVNFTSTKLKEGMRLRYRFPALAYVHYKDDGTIAQIEQRILDNGVGQYSATWDVIEAEWHMGTSDRAVKKETSTGFEMRNLGHGDYLRFPYIHDMPRDAVLELRYACATPTGGRISVRSYEPNGPELGGAEFKPSGGWNEYRTLEIALDQHPAGTLSLAFVVEGKEKGELVRIDSFRVRR